MLWRVKQVMTTQVVETIVLAELVEKDLREQGSVDERKVLENNLVEWVLVLKDLKRKTEQQFTKSKMQATEAWTVWQVANADGSIEDDAVDTLKVLWMDECLRNLKWRTKANFFLYKIEGRLAYIKTIKG